MSKFFESSRIQFVSLLTLALSFFVLRQPGLLLSPRVWAEEGDYYFDYAYTNGFWDALTHTYTAGYYNLFANLGAVLSAQIFPLEQKAAVTTYLSLLVMLIPVTVIATGTFTLWDNFYKKVVCTLIVILAPWSGESFLNSINLHFHMGAATAFVLWESLSGEEPKGIRALWYRVILVMGGLSGLVSVFMTPFFIWLAWSRRTPERFKQMLCLLPIAILQSVIVIYVLKFSTQSESQFVNRVSENAWPLFVSLIWCKSFLLSIFGQGIADGAAAIILAIKNWNMHSMEFLGVILFVMESFVLLFLVKRWSGTAKWVMLGSYLFLFVLSHAGALPPKWQYLEAYNGQRYSFVPNMLFLMLLFGAYEWNLSALRHKTILVTFLIFIFAMITQLSNYRRMAIYHHDWPIWKEEVAKWRQDPSYHLEHWPKGWRMSIPEKTKE